MSRASCEKFNYLLRPAKQVERKLIIEALAKIGGRGFDAHNSTYFGFGSVYYADFLLFHRYLYMDKMVCAESSDIPRRMEFNKPYDFIDLYMHPASTVIAKLDRERSHLAWLDYDTEVTGSVVRDVESIIEALCPGSILLITVDVDASPPDTDEYAFLSLPDRVARRIVDLESDVGKWLDHEVRPADYTKGGFPTLSVEILQAAVNNALLRRSGLSFVQLFHYVYADNAQMLTWGGLIDTVERNEDLRSEISQEQIEGVALGEEPLRITVPPLTIRERNFLDQHVQSLNEMQLPFELAAEHLEAFRRHYRHYPTYFETLL